MTRGALLVPVRNAYAHRAPAPPPATAPDGLDLRRALLADLVPHAHFRARAPVRIHTRPRHVVTVAADGGPAAATAATIATLLADPHGDLVVRAEFTGDLAQDTVERLRDAFGPDPRVRIAPAGLALGDFPDTPLHIAVPAGARCPRGLLGELGALLGDAATAELDLQCGAAARIARTWALHRAARGGGTAADFGAAAGRAAAPRRPGRARHGHPRPRLQLPAPVHRLSAAAGQVAGIATAWRFLGWLARRTRRRLAAPATAVAPVPVRAAAPRWPRVSIIAVARSAADVQAALATTRRQAYPCLELVLAVHGGAPVPAAVDGAPFPVRALHVDGGAPLGTLLNAATEAAAGALLATLECGDVYAAAHVRDLVRAWRATGAAVVDKGYRTAYRPERDETLRIAAGAGDPGRTSTAGPVAGGTLLVARSALYRVGGWRRQGPAPDAALVADVRRVSGTVHRTAGAGYLAMLGGDRVWPFPMRLVARATARRGYRPALAGLAPGSAPP